MQKKRAFTRSPPVDKLKKITKSKKKNQNTTHSLIAHESQKNAFSSLTLRRAEIWKSYPNAQIK